MPLVEKLESNTSTSSPTSKSFFPLSCKMITSSYKSKIVQIEVVINFVHMVTDLFAFAFFSVFHTHRDRDFLFRVAAGTY